MRKKIVNVSFVWDWTVTAALVWLILVAIGLVTFHLMDNRVIQDVDSLTDAVVAEVVKMIPDVNEDEIIINLVERYNGSVEITASSTLPIVWTYTVWYDKYGDVEDKRIIFKPEIN